LRNQQICKNKLESFPGDLVALESCTLHPDGSISDNVDEKCKYQLIMQRGEANILTRLFDAILSDDKQLLMSLLKGSLFMACKRKGLRDLGPKVASKL
jgi:hypothetical protein